MANQSVRITNYGDTDYRDKYANEYYDIPAGSEAVVPWDAAALWLGDPRLWNVGGRDMARRNEYDRICARMGIYDERDAFDAARPKLRVVTFDGREIPMVADDPNGEAIDVFGQGHGRSEDHDLNAEVSQLRALVNKLVGKADGKLGGELADLAKNADGLPVDGEVEPVKVGPPPRKATSAAQGS